MFHNYVGRFTQNEIYLKLIYNCQCVKIWEILHFSLIRLITPKARSALFLSKKSKQIKTHHAISVTK